MKYTVSLIVVIAWCLMGSVGVRAHHSGSEYARSTIEIEGTLQEVAWQNPHVHFFVRAKDANGNDVTWDIEANSLSILRRTDANARQPESRRHGESGRRTVAAERRIGCGRSNILAANGREIVLGPGITPRWTKNEAIGSKSTWFEGGTAANKTAGIFRVWSTKFGEPGGLWRGDYPLTDAAKKARASFNPLTDSVAPGCRPKGMPTIMEQPYPLEFVKKGDDDPAASRGVRHRSHDRHDARCEVRCASEDVARSIEGTMGRGNAGGDDRSDRLGVHRSQRHPAGPVVIDRRTLHADP